jgi:hypothetical protein
MAYEVSATWQTRGTDKADTWHSVALTWQTRGTDVADDDISMSNLLPGRI